MKAYYVDNKIFSIGSFNNDVTSFAINNEANYLIKKNNYNQKFFNEIDKMIGKVTINCRKLSKFDIDYLPKKRVYLYNFFYFWIWLMEKTIPMGKIKYN